MFLTSWSRTNTNSSVSNLQEIVEQESLHEGEVPLGIGPAEGLLGGAHVHRSGRGGTRRREAEGREKAGDQKLKLGARKGRKQQEKRQGESR